MTLFTSIFAGSLIIAGIFAYFIKMNDKKANRTSIITGAVEIEHAPIEKTNIVNIKRSDDKETPPVSNKINNSHTNINFFGGLLGTPGKITIGGVYNENEVFPKFVNTVYMLDINWINDIANTSYRYIQQKDIDNAKLVVICSRVDIKGDKFRLYLTEPHGEYWTEYIDMDLIGKKCGRLGDKIDMYADRTLIIYGYSRAGKLYVTDIELTKFRRLLFSWVQDYIKV